MNARILLPLSDELLDSVRPDFLEAAVSEIAKDPYFALPLLTDNHLSSAMQTLQNAAVLALWTYWKTDGKDTTANAAMRDLAEEFAEIHATPMALREFADRHY